jgi:hypothetical protein
MLYEAFGRMMKSMLAIKFACKLPATPQRLLPVGFEPRSIGKEEKSLKAFFNLLSRRNLSPSRLFLLFTVNFVG